MVDVEGFRDAFKKFYVNLTKGLPMEDLTAKLYSSNLLPGDHKAKIDSLSTRREKAQHFLDAVIKPSLDIGYTEQFVNLICIMESSDNHASQFLANKIRESMGCLPGSSLHCSDGKGKYVYGLQVYNIVTW